MKKTLFLAAVAALFAFSSCQKEEAPALNQGEDLVFTATISGQDTKTTVDASAAKVAWVAEDKITITDSSDPKVSAEYKVSAINKGLATFTKVDGQPTLGAGPYTAVYGTAPSTSQSYSESAPSLPMSASSSTTTLEFTVNCGLLELSLTAGESVTGIEVTGIPTGGSKTTYTLTCSTPVSIASGAKFFIALPAGSYTSFLIKGQNGAQCKKSGSGLTIQANHITPVSFSKALHFTVQLWSGGPYWATTNIGADTPESYGQYFAWGYTTGYTYNGSEWTDGTKTTTFDATGFDDYQSHEYVDMAEANWGTGWSVPTDAQLKTLVNEDESGKCSVTYVDDDVKGIRITGTQPGYTSNSIFLPAAGFGDDGLWDYHGVFGYYWSSVTYNTQEAKYLLSSRSLGESFINKIPKYRGCPVRPVYSEVLATTGTAKATIGGKEVDVEWVQLWKDGPKFAKCNYGATDQDETSVGTKVNFSTACTSLWGSNWKTPNSTTMNDLLNLSKVSCTYIGLDYSFYGFLFQGIQDGYTGNYLFLPAGEGNSSSGAADYWSSTSSIMLGSEDKAYYLRLLYSSIFYNELSECEQSAENYVRPVLNE